MAEPGWKQHSVSVRSAPFDDATPHAERLQVAPGGGIASAGSCSTSLVSHAEAGSVDVLALATLGSGGRGGIEIVG